MKRYHVYAIVVGSKYLGEFEAESKEEAEEKASQEASVSICYHCSKEVDGLEIDEIYAEEEVI